MLRFVSVLLAGALSVGAASIGALAIAAPAADALASGAPSSTPASIVPASHTLPERTITASTAAVRHPASALLAGGQWRSAGRPVGTTLTTRFARLVRVDGTAIGGAGASLRIADALLQFSDGSSLAVHTDAAGGRSVRFPARTVRWVRLIVASVPAGERTVGLRGWTLHPAGPSSVTERAAAVGVADRDSSSGSPTDSGWTAQRDGAGQWERVRVDTATPVAAVRIAGGMSTDAESGRLDFSDGSTIAVGRLEAAGGIPTTIAFTPRVTSWVRFTATVPAGARASVRSFTAYPDGAVPRTTPSGGTTYSAAATAAPNCSGVSAAAPTDRLTLLCPSNGAAVGAEAHLVVASAAGALVTAHGWVPAADAGRGGVRLLVSARADAHGTVRITVPMRTLQRGPTAVELRSGPGAPLVVQLVGGSGVAPATLPDRPANGMTLVYDDEFSDPLSATRTGAGARYASGKPNWFGVDDFGAAIFGQPTGPDQSLATGGGVLRIAARPLADGERDAAGYGRTALGGLVSSGHLGGSGFAAQYGYFEARVLAPAGTGTWPAFWMLSAGSLNDGHDATGEVDAMEQYGGDLTHAYQTAHSWEAHGDVLARGAQPVVSGGDWALTWHTYGAKVTPSGTQFFVDGVRTATEPAVVDADQPFFFLLDLAYQDGWRTGLAGTGGRTSLYVDWVRVWV